MNNTTVEAGKTMAVVAYLTLFGTLIAFYMNKDKRNPFTAFHTRQALGLGFLYVLLGFVTSYFNSWMITYSFWIFFSVLYVYGIFGAITGKLNNIPLLGDYFQNFFKSIGQ
ncbi:hypothetical protein ITJ86_14080 [Winogradskyella sp. F6397]|uniref:DUF4870 domain-containing protein n=1 Tax=Winogradskyella marina TaxID=2785530 RepID=A0ABS0ENJ5_9FLAO|nr:MULTISPECIES: hypothetical protein [Winogradskyella]MBF8151035.1 hypothetical protein [Winogradskyella marina]